MDWFRALGRTQYFLLLGLLMISCPLVLGQDPTQNAPGDSAKYVGADVCQGCHEESYKSFEKSPHAETLKSKNATTRGCEGCHGPGADHVGAGGDPEKIWHYTDARPDAILERCTRCHEAHMAEAHVKAHLTCLTCHSAHHAQRQSALLVKPGTQLCRGCHKH